VGWWLRKKRGFVARSRTSPALGTALRVYRRIRRR
jgi:hypothetical protein